MSHERKKVISFFVTTRCNLACSYCVNDTATITEHQDIDLDFAKRGLEDFFGRREDLFGVGNHKIRFYAVGEPTTRIYLIQEITDYARLLIGDKLKIELQTNGYFGRETCEWIKENVNEVWISLDGTPRIQNSNRPSKLGNPTASTIESNIEKLSNKCFVGIRATITPETNSKQVELVDYINSLGVKWLYAEPVFSSVRLAGINNGTITELNLDEYAQEFLRAHLYAKTKRIFYGNFFMMNFDEPCQYACRSCLPMPQLTTDGYVSGCDLAYFGKTQLSEFIFGKYDKDKNKIIYFPEKINRIRERKVENISECLDCEVKSNCAGGCAGLAYYATGKYLGVVEEFCKVTKFLSKYLPKNNGCVEHLHP